MSAIVDFLCGSGRDAAGRSLDELLASSDAELESRHDFIQWLFPLTEPSRAVPGSPVLTPADIAAIRADEEARDNLEEAAGRMLRFYRDTGHWRAPVDHNHLRISRIIGSLRLLVGDPEADAFRDGVLKLLGHPPPVSRRTLDYWMAA